MTFREENTSLKAYNTFGIDVKCSSYQSFKNSNDLDLIFSNLDINSNYIVIGKGSNLLFVNDFNGHVLQSVNDTLEIIHETDNDVTVKAGAGLEWDKFVEWSVNNNYWGVENLSLIPGTIGASPVQNIGAYGVEVSDLIESVTFYDPTSRITNTLKKNECNFGYRDSIFKSVLKSVIVISVTFKLYKQPNRKLDYKDIKQYIEHNKISEPVSLNTIRKAIISIRSAKLPDPEVIGNGGSFFKNPIISMDHYRELTTLYSELPSYPISEHNVKVPAAWLIENCGWKGFRRGDAGVHVNQALVLVNYGNASGQNILDLSTEIIESISKKFNIILEREIIIL